jgi:histone chaperone ASF1
MSSINVTDVRLVGPNPAPFASPFEFEITFECYPPGVQSELEWRLVYVGSAEDQSKDQELDAVLVGPVAIGKNKFTFSAPSPDPIKIPEKDLMEFTVIFLTCSYRDHEFIRIGYYVNNEYPSSEAELKAQYENAVKARLAILEAQDQEKETEAEGEGEGEEEEVEEELSHEESPPELPSSSSPPSLPPLPKVIVEKLYRNVLKDRPRVTRFQIQWDEEKSLYEMNEEDKMRAEEMQQAEGIADTSMQMEEEQEEEEEEQEEEEEEEMDEEEAVENPMAAALES